MTEKFNREEKVFENKVQEFYTSSGYDMLMVAEGHKRVLSSDVRMRSGDVKKPSERNGRAFFGLQKGRYQREMWKLIKLQMERFQYQRQKKY